MARSTTPEISPSNMLKLVRYGSESAEVASSARDAAIREAYLAGVSLRDIAEASGTSHMRVKRIIERSSD